MIRLIASDLDATMVPEGTFDLNPEYFDVIRQLKQKGILFVAASGRHYTSIEKLMKPVGSDIVALGGNGTCIMYGGKPISYTEIGQDLYLRVLRAARECHPEMIMTENPDVVYTDSDNEPVCRWVLDGYRVNLRKCDDLAEVRPPILKSALYVTDAARDVEKLRGEFGDELNIMTAGDHWVDIVSKEADKGSALGKVQELFGISREETIAFGDNGNDIGMLKLAGHSYAVGNAREEVKAAADEVIGPIGEDAVLRVLKGLL